MAALLAPLIVSAVHAAPQLRRGRAAAAPSTSRPSASLGSLGSAAAPRFSAQRCRRVRSVRSSAVASAAAAPAQKKQLNFPWVKIVGQEEMKLALILNVIDPSIGGVLIMGDRGTGKSVAVRQRIAFYQGSPRPEF